MRGAIRKPCVDDEPKIRVESRAQTPNAFFKLQASLLLAWFVSETLAEIDHIER